MSLPTSVRTDRFTLPLVSYDEARAALDGQRAPTWHEDYPRRDDLDAFSMIKGDDPWGPRHIVRSFDSLAVGSIGFFGPPEPSDDEVPEVEVGFGLVEYARGHGVATETLLGLLTMLDELGVRVRASAEPSNTASLRVLAKTGFTGLRRATSEGLLVMVRPLRG